MEINGNTVLQNNFGQIQLFKLLNSEVFLLQMYARFEANSLLWETFCDLSILYRNRQRLIGRNNFSP